MYKEMFEESLEATKKVWESEEDIVVEEQPGELKTWHEIKEVMAEKIRMGKAYTEEVKLEYINRPMTKKGIFLKENIIKNQVPGGFVVRTDRPGKFKNQFFDSDERSETKSLLNKINELLAAIKVE